MWYPDCKGFHIGTFLSVAAIEFCAISILQECSLFMIADRKPLSIGSIGVSIKEIILGNELLLHVRLVVRNTFDDLYKRVNNRRGGSSVPHLP